MVRSSFTVKQNPAATSRPSLRSTLVKIVAQEDLNFLLTNRLPRRLTTRLVGRISKIENPIVCRTALAAWKLFADLDLSDAATTQFRSVHDCFTRSLKPDARPIDTRDDVMVSPCDAIVGAHGRIEGDRVYQVKGFPYSLKDLIGDAADTDRYRGGSFVTLRLTSSMYHRFHAPHDLSVEHVTYISGDTWNVNPIALKRIEKLFCKNERSVIECRLATSQLPILIVPVAAILVASIRLHCCDTERHLRKIAAEAMADSGNTSHAIPCSGQFEKGQEMGWFEHGSTIVLFVPPGIALMPTIREGEKVRVGQALFHVPSI